MHLFWVWAVKSGKLATHWPLFWARSPEPDKADIGKQERIALRPIRQ
jgi:hypothetical protein